ncbi:MAG TPA: hypothetical protein VN156_10305, partial [Pseudomonas sp.]|nr:hypothetical protein [Pseudomonas sp.]
AGSGTVRFRHDPPISRTVKVRAQAERAPGASMTGERCSPAPAITPSRGAARHVSRRLQQPRNGPPSVVFPKPWIGCVRLLQEADTAGSDLDVVATP